MLMEAMIDAGVHMGFSRETATTLVHHTLLGMWSKNPGTVADVLTETVKTLKNGSKPSWEKT